MIDDTILPTKSDKLLELASQIVIAYLSQNSLDSKMLPDVIQNTYATLLGLQNMGEIVPNPRNKPAVPIKKSITDDYIICLEDGKKLKMMKRYLRSKYGLSPQQYRSKWGLAPDYPMVSPNYAARRSNFAKINGLGKKGK